MTNKRATRGNTGALIRVGFALTWLVLASAMTAAEANSARVTQIIKEVKVLSGATFRAANVSEQIGQGSAVRTGTDSRAELTFSDLTITRLGSNTIFSFNEGARELTLNAGAILVQVPRNSAAVRINSAAVTAAISGGTALMNVNEAAPTKLFAFEGHGQLCSKKTGECQTAAGGEMVMMTVDGHVTKPQQFNVELLYNTSPLITAFPPLPNADLIALVIDQQHAEQQIAGSGYSAIDLGKVLDVLDQHESAVALSNPTQPPAPPGPITATFTGLAAGNWSSAASWNPAVVPNNTASQQYNAIMPNGTLSQDIAGGVTIDQFTMSGGTLILNNPLALNAGLQFNGGTFSGGTLSIAGPSNQAASMSLNGTTITNTGIYDVIVDGQPVFSGSGTFNNAGTLAKTTGPGTDTVGIALNNTGLVRAENGILAINGGGASEGTFSAGLNAEISFGNDYLFNNGTRFSGPGAISLASGRIFTVNGAITNDAQLALGGEIRLNASTSWSGAGILQMANGAAIGGTGTFTNASTIEGAGSLGMNQIGIANANGGLIDSNTAHGLLILQPDQTGLTNKGTLRASNGAMLLLSGLGGGSFNNTGGTITALDAEVQLSSGAAIIGGTLNSSGSGAIRTLNAASLNSVTNEGVLLVDDGAATTLIGTLTNTGSISLNSATNFSDLVLDGGVTLSGGGTISLTNSARIRGSGILTNIDNVLHGDTRNLGSIGNGEIGIINQVNGTIDANVAGASLEVNPSGAGLDNAGVMRANGGILLLSGAGGGAFHNTGTVEAVNGGAIHLTAALTSSGLVDLAANTMTIADPGSYTQTAGMFTLAGGTVNSTSTLNFRGGTLDAYGTINASVDNNGTLQPALSGNGLAVNGNLRLLGSSHLTLQLGGLNQGSQYSFINVRGGVALGGTLVVSFVNGFQNSISNSDTFTVLASSSKLTGSFVNVPSGGRVATSDNSGSFLVNDSGNTIVLSDFLPSNFNSNVVFNGLPNGLWSDPASWSPMVVPNNAGGQAFNASMSSGMLTQDISAGVTIQNFNMGGGTLVLNNPLSLNAGLTYGGGNINGGVLTVGGTSVQSTTLSTTGLTINNSGDYELSFDNANAFSGPVTFSNSGTVRKSTGPGILTFNAGLNNTGGIMLAQNGTLQFSSGGSGAGTFSADAGASIVFAANFSFADGTTFGGGGDIVYANATSTTWSGTMTNNGHVVIGSTGSFTDLNLSAATVTLTGSGRLSLQNAARVLGGGLLVNQSTIDGETSNGGGLGYDQIAISNDASGVIHANVTGKALVVDPINAGAQLTNNGLMQASNGGLLLLSGNNGGSFNNAGSIVANDGSEVQLTAGANVVGGTLATAGSGVIRNLDSATLDSLTINGTFISNNASSTAVTSRITNNGTMLLNSTGSFTDLTLHGTNVTLTGSGTLTLQNADRVLGGGTLTNQSTIVGETSNGGGLGYDQIAISNANGALIGANVNGKALVIDPVNAGAQLTNDGVLEASNGGILLLTGNDGGSFNNHNVIIAQAASEVQLTAGANLIGGTLTSSGSGVTRNLDSATLDSLTINGTFIGNNASSTAISGTITNNGTMLIASTGSFTDVNLHGANATLAGSGILTLQNADRVLGGGTLTNQSTIEGETSNGGGLGYDQIAIVNTVQGLIDANATTKAFIVDPVNAGAQLTNEGVMQARNGGILLLTGNDGGSFFNDDVIQALDGSEVQLTNGANIIGGSLHSIGSGIIRNLGSATLDGITLTGSFIANNASSTAFSNTVTNNGTMLINSTGSFTDVNLHGTNVTLTGSGVLTLQNADRILGGGTLTNQSTIEGETSNGGGLGYDQIAINNTANGVINANVSGKLLDVDPINAGVQLTNNGVMRATNGGILVLDGNNGGEFFNNNLIEAQSGSEVQLTNGATVVGGALQSSGTGIVRNLNSTTLDSVTLAGQFIANNATSTLLSNTVTNNGSILINSTGSFTDVNLHGTSATLAGTGTLTLQNADRILGGGTLTNQSTIEGETSNGGGLGYDQIAVLNDTAGVINANVSGLALTIDPVNAGAQFTNKGLAEASNRGVLLLSGNNSGGFVNEGTLAAASGGTINLGGVLTSTSTGVLNLRNGTFLDNGSADVNQVTGTVGTINVAAGASFSAVSDFDFSGGANGVTNGGTLDFTAPAITFGQAAGQVNGANFDGADAPAGTNAAGGDGGTVNVTATTGDINVGSTQLLASSGLNGSSTVTGGNGGTVNLTATSGAINVDGKIQVSDNGGSRKSARGGNINVTSGKTSGVAINISNTGQLLSLLNAAAPGPGGKIVILASAPSASSSVNVSGRIQADRGAVDIRHAGDTGTVTLNNATLSGDIVKAAALGANGTLTIGGGTISADTVLKLYATGSNGTVNFIASVSLNGASAKTIAGNTVNIFDNVTVTIGGGKPVDVFTNNANYTGFGGNGSRKGTFAGAGADNPQPLPAPPLGPPGGP